MILGGGEEREGSVKIKKWQSKTVWKQRKIRFQGFSNLWEFSFRPSNPFLSAPSFSLMGLVFGFVYNLFIFFACVTSLVFVYVSFQQPCHGLFYCGSVWNKRGRGLCEWTCLCSLEGSCQIASFRKLPQRQRGGAAVWAIGFCSIERLLFEICGICSIAIGYKESFVSDWLLSSHFSVLISI